MPLIYRKCVVPTTVVTFEQQYNGVSVPFDNILIDEVKYG